ncbi:hypothetical protein PR048_014087 [Dryococelus australis]|uniref:HTH psq-type domain-containing protein n=1 Tax=Dryococelus australis TaxID=614101 RepID=A0ABQ9HU16_9NEOP|nr:hypothetical protein PR048_014087 [Dryococelus australis]
MARGKRKIKTWVPENMRYAVVAVRAHEMEYLRAAKTYGVPIGTLKKYIKNKGKTPESILEITPGRKSELPPVLEKLLVRYCMEMEGSFNSGGCYANGFRISN